MTVPQFNHPIDGHWSVSSFLLLRIKILYTFFYKSLRRHMYAAQLEIYLAVKLLGYIVYIRLSFIDTVK